MRSKNKKRKVISILGYSLFILFWLIVICLSLELWERLRWKYIEKTNKYVLIRQGKLLIKEWDGEQEERIHYGEGKHLFLPQQILVGDEWCEPQPDPLELWNYRFHFYFCRDEPFQSAFRNIYDMDPFRVEIHKNLNLIFKQINNDIEQNKFTLYQSIINHIPKNKFLSGTSFLHEENIGGTLYGFFFYPIHEQPEAYIYHTFSFPNKGKNDPLNPRLGRLAINDLWDINYFSYKPHINSTEMLFRTNNFGFRDRDFKLTKKKGVFRILCVGASTTEEGISNKEAYPKFLEEELRKYFGENRIEVFNCGISGMTMKKHYAKLPDYLYLQPDMVILYEGINDIIYEVFPHAFDNSPKITQLAFLLSHFVRRQMRSLLDYPQEELEAYIQMCIFQYILYFNNVLLSHNIDFCISSIGVPYRERLNQVDRDYYDYYYDKEWGWVNSTFKQYCDVMKLYNQRLKEYCKQNGLLYVPVDENMPASTKYFGDICHMRQPGVRLKAQIMAKTLIPYLEKFLGSPQNSTASPE